MNEKGFLFVIVLCMLDQNTNRNRASWDFVGDMHKFNCCLCSIAFFCDWNSL